MVRPAGACDGLGAGSGDNGEIQAVVPVPYIPPVAPQPARTGLGDRDRCGGASRTRCGAPRRHRGRRAWLGAVLGGRTPDAADRGVPRRRVRRAVRRHARRAARGRPPQGPRPPRRRLRAAPLVRATWVLPGRRWRSGSSLGALVCPLSHLADGDEQEVVTELNSATAPSSWCSSVGAGRRRAGASRSCVPRPAAAGAPAPDVPRRPRSRSRPSRSASCTYVDPSLGTVVARSRRWSRRRVDSGVFAVRTGDLSRSILLHAGLQPAHDPQAVVS